MHISRLFQGLFTSEDRPHATPLSTDAQTSLPEADPKPVGGEPWRGPRPRGHLSRHQLSGNPRSPARISDLERQLARLAARPDASCFAGELREIRIRIAQARQQGTAPGGGQERESVLLDGAQLWLARLGADLNQIDRLPGGWASLVTDRRDLAPAVRAVVEQRAFRAARLMAAERCDAREAMAMSRRAEARIAAGCPETSALLGERVRRELLRRHPEGIVDPLTRMLRMDGPAVYSDAMAVLRVMTRLPARLAEQLADAGVTIVPTPGRLANVRPQELGNAASQGSAGLYVTDAKALLVVTTRDSGSDAARLLTNVSPLHEAAHAYEQLVGTQTHADPDFRAARARDLAGGHIRPGRDDYFRDTDTALGSRPEAETFAESLAHYLLGDRRWPALHAYWDGKFRSAPPAG